MSISDFFNTAITIKKASTTQDSFGEAADDTDLVVNARVERDVETLTKTNGREGVVEALLIMPANTAIARLDQVVLDGERMSVLAVGKETHGDGSIHHLEVAVGRV